MVIKSIWRKIGKIFFDFSVNLGHTGVHKDKLLIKLLENHMVTTRPGWVWIRGFFYRTDNFGYYDRRTKQSEKRCAENTTWRTASNQTEDLPSDVSRYQAIDENEFQTHRVLPSRCM